MALTTKDGKLPVIIVNNTDDLIRNRAMRFKLVTFSNNLCTIGNLYLTHDDCVQTDELICHTMELPWNHNKPFFSCIPAGVYDIETTDSPKFGLTYKVKNVVGRTDILFHKANKPSDLLGCIAPCKDFGVLDGEWAGLNSKAAYDPLMQLFAGDSHTLEIKRF
jgi:hypothetical protein